MYDDLENVQELKKEDKETKGPQFELYFNPIDEKKKILSKTVDLIKLPNDELENYAVFIRCFPKFLANAKVTKANSPICTKINPVCMLVLKDKLNTL